MTILTPDQLAEIEKRNERDLRGMDPGDVGTWEHRMATDCAALLSHITILQSRIAELERGLTLTEEERAVVGRYRGVGVSKIIAIIDRLTSTSAAQKKEGGE